MPAWPDSKETSSANSPIRTQIEEKILLILALNNYTFEMYICLAGLCVAIHPLFRRAHLSLSPHRCVVLAGSGRVGHVSGCFSENLPNVSQVGSEGKKMEIKQHIII